MAFSTRSTAPQTIVPFIATAASAAATSSTAVAAVAGRASRTPNARRSGAARPATRRGSGARGSSARGQRGSPFWGTPVDVGVLPRLRGLGEAANAAAGAGAVPGARRLRESTGEPNARQFSTTSFSANAALGRNERP